jgi:membrane associated rhomboid family serine protease
MLWSTILILLLNLLVGLNATGVDVWAHLGGFIVGLLVGAAIVQNYNWRGNERLYQRVAGAAAVAFLVLSTVFVFVRA